MPKLETRNWKLDNAFKTSCSSQFQVSNFPNKTREQKSVNYFPALMKDAGFWIEIE